MINILDKNKNAEYINQLNNKDKRKKIVLDYLNDSQLSLIYL